MSHVSHKREAIVVDATPEKRMFWSIISDYDIQAALCELIDNALDQWMANGSLSALDIELILDPDRQLISVKDNAGGVSAEELRMLIAPGTSMNDPNAETIGIFGVGSKRAVVALAENVAIKTHRKGGKSYQIDVTTDWLESEDWAIPAYEIPEMQDSMTLIELSALRQTFNGPDVELIKRHLGETYEWFLKSGKCSILVNGGPVEPRDFECWAFPRSQLPQRVSFTVQLPTGEKVRVDITGGLIRDRDPGTDNYGVYFYCNHRLIAKHLKTREVGYFVSSEAGVPHPDASLCRAIVRLEGMAKLMPWNSTKTGINYGHPLFEAIRPTLIQLVSHFSSLSRRLKDDWNRKVFKFGKGEIQVTDQGVISQGKRLVLPPLPRVNRPHVESLKARNKTRIEDQPWILGLVEAVAAVTILSRQRLETKNRIALIILDSNFEIALKEFVVHRADLFPPRIYTDKKIRQLFKHRHSVITEVSKKINISRRLVEKAKHYYGLRNKFVHERATVDITDSDVQNYDATIREILKILFDLDL